MAYNITDAKNMYFSQLLSFKDLQQHQELTIEENERLSRVCISLSEIQKTQELINNIPVMNIQQIRNGFKIIEISPEHIENIFSFSQTIFYLLKICLKYDTKENINLKLNWTSEEYSFNFLNNYDNIYIDSSSSTIKKIRDIVDLLKKYGIIINSSPVEKLKSIVELLKTYDMILNEE